MRKASYQPVLERIPLSGPASLTVREFRRRAFDDPWHEHPEVELTWILKGSGTRHVGDSVEPFRAGDFCLLGSNLPHAWISRGGRGGVLSLVVQFDPSRWGDVWLHLPEFAGIADLFARASRGLWFDAGTVRRLRRKLPVGAGPLRRFTALLEILDALAAHPGARALALAPRARRAAGDARLGRVLAYLSGRAGEPVSQAEAAAKISLSPAAFSRFFRRAVGKTFQAYVNDMRLGEACRRLLETDAPVGEIAFASGFGNLSNFNRAFRMARGMPPLAFRRCARRAVEVSLC